MVHKRSPELIKCIYDCKLEEIDDQKRINEYNEKNPTKQITNIIELNKANNEKKYY